MGGWHPRAGPSALARQGGRRDGVAPGRRHVRSDGDDFAATQTPPPARRPFDGIDLLPIVTSDKTVERPLSGGSTGRIAGSAPRGSAAGNMCGTAPSIPFDLDADPGERENLGYREPARLADLRQRLARWEEDADKSSAEFPMNFGSAASCVRSQAPAGSPHGRGPCGTIQVEANTKTSRRDWLVSGRALRSPASCKRTRRRSSRERH